MSLRLDTPLQYLKGVGPRRAEALARLSLHTVEDLLYHVPHRYLDATSVTAIAKVTVGQEVTLVGRVLSTGVLPTRKRLRIFRAILRDSSGVIECAWPGQAFLERTIRKGQLLLVTGPVRYFHGRHVVPSEQIVLAEEGEEDEEARQKGLVLPVYPATEGLSHRQIRRLVADHLDQMLATVEDIIPVALRRDAGVLPLRDAFVLLHRPPSLEKVEAARRRLAFDELFDLQLVVARARHLTRASPRGPRFQNRKHLTTSLKESLPFTPTAGQRRAIRETFADMTGPDRMHRLLMGDGAGLRRT